MAFAVKCTFAHRYDRQPIEVQCISGIALIQSNEKLNF